MKKLLEREFILSVLGAVLSIYGAVQGMIDPALAAKIASAILMVYTVSRAIVKFTPTKKDDEILDKIAIVLREKKLLN